MKNKIFKNNTAFSLTELLVAMTVIVILAGAVTLSSTTMGRQTAKREAERVAEKLRSVAMKSDREHKSYTIKFPNKGDAGLDYFEILDETKDLNHKVIETFNASKGCKFKTNVEELTYDLQLNMFNGFTLTITGADGNKYEVVITAVDGGRIRVAPKE